MHHGPIITHEATLRELQLKLGSLCEELHEIISPSPSRSVKPVYHQLTASRVEQILRARRARDKVFGSDLFADPAWDILLESLLTRLRQTRISVSGLCAVAAVPATTALRWILKLEQDDLLTRENDLLDHRRTWIRLTDKGMAAMQQYFAMVWSAPSLV